MTFRKPAAVLMSIASVAVASASIAPAAASAAQRIDMKVLLLGTSSTEPDFVSWQDALQREGVPFEAIVTSPGHAAITAATLSDTLANGTPEAKYQAVIVSVGDLPECKITGGKEECVSTLSAVEWTALEEYEQTFNVRQVTGDIYPSATYGLNAATTTGTLEGSLGTLTTEGKTVFPYLNGPVSLDTGTYGYEATPLATQAAGASFNTLVSGPSGSALVGVYTHPNGIQEMVETFDQNDAQLQAELLRHGALDWVTRGVYFGDQRNYVEMDIDDTFTPDDAWDTATHEINYDNADSLRIKAADVDYAAKWEKEHGGFRMEQLFNGGGSVEYQADNGGVDPVLAEFQKEDPETKKPYADSFGWLSHTYDTPYMDVGCATQDYIEAELTENTNWAAAKPGTTPGTGGLGLTETTELANALGTENPKVFVPGNHSGFADLVPGNPATVDAPEFDADEKAEEDKGTLAAGSYEYAITDQFTEAGGESAADVTAPLTVPADGAVTLEWEAICHAADYRIYRAVAKSGKWFLIDTVKTPFSATLPDNSVGEDDGPKPTEEVTGGGERELTVNDTGIAGTAQPTGWTPPITENAVESAWEQNPYFAPALEAVGITDVGDDGSKAYPNPPTVEFGIGVPSYVGPEFAADETFVDGKAQVVPRHPINIYYNASTEAQEVDEWNTLFLPPAQGGQCENTSTTTCEEKAATFAEIIKSVVSGMFQNMMGNDPRPSYVHQTNIMGQPPAGEPTNSTPLPNTPEKTGDGLLYSVLNPLLAEYKNYFASTAPFEQLTLGAIGNVLAEQAAWKAATTAGSVKGYIEENKVTIENTGAAAVNTPLTGVTGVGSSYGGITSGWTSIPVGTSAETAPTTWPAAPAEVQQEPQGSWVGKVGSAGYLLADWDGAQDFSDMPNVTTTLVQGSRYQWAANTTDVRALEGPEGTTRNASTYYDPKEIKLQLGFATQYVGTLHMYAVDWDSTARRETFTVNDGTGPRSVLLTTSFNAGAWVSLPINVAAGGTVTIAVQNTAGANAVLSGVFLGEAGAPPSTGGQELSEGGWVNAVGSAGYDLAGWDGPTGDVSYIPNATVSLVQGTRFQWAAHTEDPRALSEPGTLTRNAAAYYDPNQVQVKLNFTAAYTGTLHTYALDWDSTVRRETITVNGQTAVLSSSFNKGAWVSFPISVAAGGTVTITVDRTAGPNAVLSGIFLGEAGTPPGPTVASAPQGTWVNAVGSAGYDLADWDGTQDVSYLPNASVSLLQGSRFQWASGSTDPRALSDPTGVTHNAGTYYDPNEIQLKLTFTKAYEGNLHLYAVDWDKLTRREIITVNGQSAVLGEFTEGAWVSFPIKVAEGGTVTITVDRTFGPNAVLSGIFLGEGSAPAAAPVTSAPQGSWVGTYGASGYDLLAFNGSTDLASLTNASLTVEQGSRFQWAPSTTEVRALENPGKTARVAATLYDPNQIKLYLSFTAAYKGNLELYAVDWDSTTRREAITVNGQTAVLSSAFHEGAWVSFPINVAAGGTATVTVDRLAGENAVLSGVFLG
jgi:hypothetical protein